MTPSAMGRVTHLGARRVPPRRRTVQVGAASDQLAGRAQEPAPAPGVARGHTGMTDGSGLQPAQSGPPTQHPLAAHDPIVAEGGDRQALRTSPAGSRGMQRCKRAHCPQRVRAEVLRPVHHPPWVAAAGAEPDAARVRRDPVRPPSQRSLQSRIARRGTSRNREREHREAAQNGCTKKQAREAVRGASRRSRRSRPARRLPRRTGRRRSRRRPAAVRPPC